MDEKSRNIFYIVQGNEATEEDYLIEIAQRIIDETVKYCGGKEQHVETVVLLGDKRVDGHIKIDVDVEKLDNTGGRATYAEIKDYIKEKYGYSISSLEELIESARNHGVRLVACQMSMDVMGIKQEELIDGVELGGVATFIGSGETSDISLFI